MAPRPHSPPLPSPPALTSPDLLGIQSLLGAILESPDIKFVVVCFAALFLTTAIAVLIIMRLRKGNTSVVMTEARYKTVLRYLDALEMVRVEQDQLLKRQLREGRWSDAQKAAWDDDIRELQRTFDLQRSQFAPILGTRALAVLRSRNSVFSNLTTARMVGSAGADVSTPAAAARAPAATSAVRSGDSDRPPRAKVE